MSHTHVGTMLLLGTTIVNVLGGTEAAPALEEKEVPEWEYSLSVTTYLQPHTRDYANPVFTADRDWIHLEGRYNYESLKTGSAWLGYNLDLGKMLKLGDKLSVETTLMVGGVFGEITGVAPGYGIGISYGPFEFYTEGEYFFDANVHYGNFFYNWSEASWKLRDWCRVGVALDRTRVVGADTEVRRGPLLGFQYRNIDFTTYWLAPGQRDATIVFGVTYDF